MVTIENGQIFSTEGKLIHRLGSETYFKRSTALPGDSAEDFEEVEEIPAFSEAKYKERVQALIAERYSIGDEVAIINNRGDGDPEHEAEHAEYMAYRALCKAKAREELS